MLLQARPLQAPRLVPVLRPQRVPAGSQRTETVIVPAPPTVSVSSVTRVPVVVRIGVPVGDIRERIENQSHEP